MNGAMPKVVPFKGPIKGAQIIREDEMFVGKRLD
jgi:hypothetical protein